MFAKDWELRFCVSVQKQKKHLHAGQLMCDPTRPQGRVHLTRLLFAKWANGCASFQLKDSITARTLCLDYTLLVLVPKCFLLALQLRRRTRTANRATTLSLHGSLCNTWNVSAWLTKWKLSSYEPSYTETIWSQYCKSQFQLKCSWEFIKNK